MRENFKFEMKFWGLDKLLQMDYSQQLVKGLRIKTSLHRLQEIFETMPQVGDLSMQAWFKDRVPPLDIEALIKEGKHPEPDPDIDIQ